MTGHRALVTGGAGFIGSHLVEALVHEGWRVRVLDNFSTGYRRNLQAVTDSVEVVQGDICDEACVREAMAQVEVVFHLAAMVSVPLSMTDPATAERINVLGTLHVLEAARHASVRRVVLSSTCAVYGDEPSLPKYEHSPLHPKSPYAISKRAAEQYCKFYDEHYGLESVILRYFNVYGPRQNPSSPYSGVISIFLDRLLRVDPVVVYGTGEQSRDFVFVADVVRANLMAAWVPTARGECFNVGTGRSITVNHVYTALAAQVPDVPIPNHHEARTGDVLHSRADTNHAWAILGWRASTSFEEGIAHLMSTAQKKRPSAVPDLTVQRELTADLL